MATRINNFNGQVTIDATVNSACGAVGISRSTWVGTRKPVGFISVIVDPWLGRIKAKVAPVPGATSYEWYLDGVKYTGPGANGDYVTMPIPRNNCTIPDYSVGVKAINACGTSAGHYGIFENPCYQGSFYYTYFPNPASEMITIERINPENSNNNAESIFVNRETDRAHYYRLYHSGSNAVVSEGLLSTKTEIDLSAFDSGDYILKILIEKNRDETHRVIIN